MSDNKNDNNIDNNDNNDNLDPNAHAEKLAQLSVEMAQQAQQHAASLRGTSSTAFHDESDPNALLEKLMAKAADEGTVFNAPSAAVKPSDDEVKKYQQSGSVEPHLRLSAEMEALQHALKDVRSSSSENGSTENTEQKQTTDDVPVQNAPAKQDAQPAGDVSNAPAQQPQQSQQSQQQEQSAQQEEPDQNSDEQPQDAPVQQQENVPADQKAQVGENAPANQPEQPAQSDAEATQAAQQEEEPPASAQETIADSEQPAPSGEQEEPVGQDEHQMDKEQQEQGSQEQQEAELAAAEQAEAETAAQSEQTFQSSKPHIDKSKDDSHVNKDDSHVKIVIKGAKFGTQRPKQEDVRTHDVIIAKNVDEKRDKEVGVALSKYNLNYVFSEPDDRDHKFGVIFGSIDAKYLPTSSDLRPSWGDVLDQLDLGSCVSNSVSYCVRYAYKREKLGDFTPSRLFIYYNGRADAGYPLDEDTGMTIRDGYKSVAHYSVCSEEKWAYNPDKFAQRPPQDCYDAAKQHKTFRYINLDNDEVQIKKSLKDGFPVSFGAALYESFMSAETARHGKVPVPDVTKEKRCGGHAMTIVGHDDESRMFLVANNWGTTWGDGGFCWFPYDYMLNDDLCGDLWSIRYWA